MIPRWLSVVLLTLFPLAALADEAAAVVAKYLPPKAEHVIERAGGDDAIAGLGTPLFAGDTVVVAAGGSLDIAYADGATESLEGPTTFAVPDKEPLGATARIYDRLQALLGRKYRQGSNLATRNPGACDANTPPLEAPVLRETSYLATGHSNIALAWLGGCAPYSLKLFAADSAVGSATVLQGDLPRPLTRFNSNQLAAGEYTLTIGDASGRAITTTILVVAAVPEDADVSADVRSELDAVAYAAWLASHDEGRWRLESFQQLRPWIRAGGAMAGTYGDLVMWGEPDLGLDGND